MSAAEAGNAQGFDPDHTIADAGQGLRAGQKTALADTPCHGDVFHIQKQCESLANVLAQVAMGATSRRKALDVKMDAAKENSRGNTLSTPLMLARQYAAKPIRCQCTTVSGLTMVTASRMRGQRQ